ncbi:MAG: hypothetical protein ABIJ20_01365 [Nanoarchaeota archaeon]
MSLKLEEVKKEYIDKVLEIVKNHKKKYNYRKMSLGELDKFCGV